MTAGENATTQPKRLHNRKVGQWGEQVAADYLIRQGYQIIDRNARTPSGELDIIAVHENGVVFVEVKTRTRVVDGYPEDALTPKKVEHLLNAAQDYLEAHPDLPDEWKVEVVAVNGRAGNYQVVLFDEVSYGR